MRADLESVPPASTLEDVGIGQRVRVIGVRYPEGSATLE